MSIIIHLFEFQLPMCYLNPEFLKRDCSTIPVAEIISGISLKKYDMEAKTFLYIIISLCLVNKLNSSMSNFGGRLSQPKKIKLFSRDFFFSVNIIQQVVDF
jgi:hypothetical protein